VETTGESSTLSHEEHIECIKFAVKKQQRESGLLQELVQMLLREAVYLSKEA
jgi:4-hydroxy-tetrahydrodipicolinate synthase